jgi:hypothetical protein
MPQFITDLPNDERVMYGFDRILKYYFVSRIDADGEVEHLVGLLSPVYGSARHTLEALAELGAKIPADHLTQLCMDLPLEETDGEPQPIPSYDEVDE